MANRADVHVDSLIQQLYAAGLSDDDPWQVLVQGMVQIMGARTGWLILTPAQGGAASQAAPPSTASRTKVLSQVAGIRPRIP